MAKGKQKSKAELDRAKEFAKILYVHQGVTDQKELSKRTGVSVTTINKWINAEDGLWKRLRESFLVTKEMELRRLYIQVSELNDYIMSKEPGKRFANSKEGDALSKLTKAIQQLESDSSLSEAMSVHKDFIRYVQEHDFGKAKEIAEWSNQHIKSLIK